MYVCSQKLCLSQLNQEARSACCMVTFIPFAVDILVRHAHRSQTSHHGDVHTSGLVTPLESQHQQAPRDVPTGHCSMLEARDVAKLKRCCRMPTEDVLKTRSGRHTCSGNTTLHFPHQLTSFRDLHSQLALTSTQLGGSSSPRSALTCTSHLHPQHTHTRIVHASQQVASHVALALSALCDEGRTHTAAHATHGWQYLLFEEENKLLSRCDRNPRFKTQSHVPSD